MEGGDEQGVVAARRYPRDCPRGERAGPVSTEPFAAGGGGVIGERFGGKGHGASVPGRAADECLVSLLGERVCACCRALPATPNPATRNRIVPLSVSEGKEIIYIMRPDTSLTASLIARPTIAGRLASTALITVMTSLILAPAAVAQTTPVPPTPTIPAAKPAALAGIYQGAIKPTPLLSLTLVFRVTGADTALTATLAVLEQGRRVLPVTKTTVNGESVTFALDLLGATFSGKRSADGNTIVGTFTQHGQSFPLTLTRTEKPMVLARPQTPKPPFPYQTEEVSYTNTKAKAPGVVLGGTLALPKGAGPFPVVLFITGSGQQDRDEMILGHRPFAVIADYLARRGIASLRVDDRGIGKSGGDFAASTTADFADDTRAGVAFLKTREKIDARRIGLIGHSEGGLIAPMVAVTNPEVAFLVLLAGTGVSGADVILGQQKAIARTMGASDAGMAENERLTRSAFAIVRGGGDEAATREKLKAMIAREVAALPEDQRGAMSTRLEGAYSLFASPWFRYFLAFDPATVLQSVTCPVLALNGSKDLQVLPADNLPPIRASLKKAGDKDVTIREMPGLNHLFQHATTGSPAEYAQITETFSPEVLTIIGDWITAHTVTPNKGKTRPKP